MTPAAPRRAERAAVRAGWAYGAREAAREAARAGEEVQLCEWFALCTNKATTTRSHPILGEVPICSRCAAKVARIAGETVRTCRVCGCTDELACEGGCAWVGSTDLCSRCAGLGLIRCGDDDDAGEATS